MTPGKDFQKRGCDMYIRKPEAWSEHPGIDKIGRHLYPMTR